MAARAALTSLHVDARTFAEDARREQNLLDELGSRPGPHLPMEGTDGREADIPSTSTTTEQAGGDAP